MPRKRQTVKICCPDCKVMREVSPQRLHDAQKKNRLYCSKCAGIRMSLKPEFKNRKFAPWNKGKKTDPEVLARTMKSRVGTYPEGARNKKWKGEAASYFAKHIWMRTHFGRADKCEECGALRSERMIHWANISGEYKRDITDWRQLCVPHHSRFDRDRKLTK